MSLEKYERNKEAKEHIKKHGFGPMKVESKAKALKKAKYAGEKGASRAANIFSR